MSDHHREITDSMGMSDPTYVRVANIFLTAPAAAEADIAMPITVKTSEAATGVAYGVAKTYVIHESEVADGFMQYELRMGDKSYTWIGDADDRADALLEINLVILGQQEDIPND